MPTRMALWRLAENGQAISIAEEPLSAEALIESAVESSPDLLGVDVLIIGRQVPTPSGPLDLLAIAADGQLVVVENKRDRTPREVLAQTIDYAAFVATLTLDDISIIYQSYRAKSGEPDADLVEAFEERFAEPLDALVETPRMIIVASRLDDSTERMIDFLVDRFAVPVNAALFQPFSGGLIGRTWLRPEESNRLQTRGTANTASRDEAKLFWDAWLPIGRQALPSIKLPDNGPRSVLIKRRIVPGIPAALTVWVSSSEAYAEIQFDDDDPAMNDALITALMERRGEIETAFGRPLDWRTQEAGGLMTKRTKVVSPKVGIGDRANPTTEGMERMARDAKRLLESVKPHLKDALDRASAIEAELDGSQDLSDDVNHQVDSASYPIGT